MSTSSYRNFAYYYNQLIPESFYLEVKDRINNIKTFNNILDLACGSGTLCFLLKNKDNQVTGLDMSSEMLMIANDKNKQDKQGVTFIQQDMRKLSLVGNTYDLVTCTLDSLNYIGSIESIEHIFKEVAHTLIDGGYFIFDLLTQFYIDEIVNDYEQGEILDNFEYNWSVKKVDDHDIKHDLVIKAGNDIYKEEHFQTIFDFNEIEQLLNKYNLEIQSKESDYNELNDGQPSRITYVTRKVGK